MNDQNVKMKTSMLPVGSEQGSPSREVRDTFISGKCSNAGMETGPADSAYSASDPRSSKWCRLSNGGPKSGMVPGVADGELMSEIDMLGEFCAGANKIERGEEPEIYKEPFVPRNSFDLYVRMIFESPDPGSDPRFKKANDDSMPERIEPLDQMLKKAVPIEDIVLYYQKELGRINELMDLSRSNLLSFTDPFSVNYNAERLARLQDFHDYTYRQLAMAEVRARGASSTDD